MTTLHPDQIRALGVSVLRIERDAIERLVDRIDEAFVRACELCIGCSARIVVVGGERLEGSRQIYWNFVSSRAEAITKAKADWAAGRFPLVPGDEEEFIPYPSRPANA